MDKFPLRLLCGDFACFAVENILPQRGRQRKMQRDAKGFLFFFLALLITLVPKPAAAQEEGNIVLHFKAVANNKAVVFNDSSYSNAFGETYSISRLKFYLSNIGFSNSSSTKKTEAVYLVDMVMGDSIVLNVAPGNYSSLHMMLGVDSALNCSGAQSGALDPLNGMFWTWNTGYIFFKLEGYSPASTADLNRIEQHVGGYRSPFNTARKMTFKMPGGVIIEQGKRQHFYIHLTLDNFFKSVHELKIAEKPMMMTPGSDAMKAADNIAQSFYVYIDEIK